MLKKYKEELQDNNKTYLKIKVGAGASKTKVKEIMADETIKIDVAILPIKGRANQELIKFLAREFEVRRNNVKIIKGERSKVKLIKIKL